MDFTDKANSLANKMNELTQKFNLSEEMVISGEDIIEDVKKKTDIMGSSTKIPTTDMKYLLVLEVVNIIITKMEIKFIF